MSCRQVKLLAEDSQNYMYSIDSEMQNQTAYIIMIILQSRLQVANRTARELTLTLNPHQTLQL